MTHYETLGVMPDAPPAEIKRAYRKKAEKAHPDKKGGNQEEMIAVNHAFDVLGDPKRRLLYDATGQDKQRPEDEQIRSLLVQAFSAALQKDAPSILIAAREFLEGTKGQMAGNKQEAARIIKGLQKRRAKIKSKGPENVFHMIIDQEIAKNQQGIAMIEEGLGICDLAIKKLAEYESSETLESRYVDFAWGVTATTSAT